MQVDKYQKMEKRVRELQTVENKGDTLAMMQMKIR
jgi:hypothetical protein